MVACEWEFYLNIPSGFGHVVICYVPADAWTPLVLNLPMFLLHPLLSTAHSQPSTLNPRRLLSLFPNSASPPPTTETPGSMSDAESAGGSTDPSSAGSMGAKRAGGLFSEGPNARSKSVTVADGDDTYGVSSLHP